MLQVDAGCTMPCAGNSAQICGDGNRMSVFAAGKPSTTAQPSDPATVGSYNFTGCYTDNTGGRALTAKSTSGSSMTIESCASYCSGYTYFGTEFADECELFPFSSIGLKTDLLLISCRLLWQLYRWQQHPCQCWRLLNPMCWKRL